MPIMLVKCPICHKPVQWDDAPCRPFCSERCRIRDLGAWVSEEYRVPAEEFHLDNATTDEENP